MSANKRRETLNLSSASQFFGGSSLFRPLIAREGHVHLQGDVDAFRSEPVARHRVLSALFRRRRYVAFTTHDAPNRNSTAGNSCATTVVPPASSVVPPSRKGNDRGAEAEPNGCGRDGGLTGRRITMNTMQRRAFVHFQPFFFCWRTQQKRAKHERNSVGERTPLLPPRVRGEALPPETFGEFC